MFTASPGDRLSGPLALSADSKRSCLIQRLKAQPVTVAPFFIYRKYGMPRAQDDIQEVLVSREDRKSVATAQDDYMDVID